MPLSDADYADLKRRLAQDTLSVAVLHVKGDADALHVIARASFRQGGTGGGSGGSGGGGGGPPTGWITPTLSGTWVAYTGSPHPYSAPQYRRDALGFVYIRGAVKNGTVATTIFTLPAGFRPGANTAMLFLDGSAQGVHGGSLYTDGTVNPPNASGNAFIGIFPPPFLAEN